MWRSDVDGWTSAKGCLKWKAARDILGAMATIPLTQGKLALIDDEDLAEISRYKWSLRTDPRGYCYARTRLPRSEGGGTALMHRMILRAEPWQQIDHCNGDGLDNRRSNMRVCSHRQNQFNQKKQRRATSSIFKGVRFCKQTGRWAATIKIFGRVRWLGRHVHERDAALAYNSAATELFGEFANLNDVS